MITSSIWQGWGGVDQGMWGAGVLLLADETVNSMQITDAVCVRLQTLDYFYVDGGNYQKLQVCITKMCKIFMRINTEHTLRPYMFTVVYFGSSSFKSIALVGVKTHSAIN